MARKKKNDFWDDMDEMDAVEGTSEDEPGEKFNDDEEWSAVKCLPLKVFMRVLLMISCLIALASGYIAYEYVGDRYAGGSYSTDFFNSGSFAEEYNKSVDQLLQLVQAMEADPSVTQAGNEELLTTLVENYMGKDTNFSFVILDGDQYPVASSDGDTQAAKDRIEVSNHYVVISNKEGEMTIQSPIAGKLLDKEAWSNTLSTTSNTYIIYSAVDNDLTQNDSFYKAQQAFDKMEGYFNIAKFAGIAAAIVFVICLIFCIMATGMKRGYDSVCLTWFDRIFTEIALVIMAAGAVALYFGIRKLWAMEGDIYQYLGLALVVVAYGWVIRSYFSIVRRIKAGRLLRGSVIGTVIGAVAKAIGRLPSPLNIILGVIILIAINGGLVYGVIFLRQYTVKGIPIMFIVAPVVFIIELLALLSRGGDEDEEDEGPEDESEEEEGGEPASGEKADARQNTSSWQNNASSEQMDWEAIDLGQAIMEAEKQNASKKPKEQPEPVMEQTVVGEEKPARPVQQRTNRQQTEVLSVEDVKKAIRASGLTPQVEDDSALADYTNDGSSAEQTFVGGMSGAQTMAAAAAKPVSEQTFVGNMAGAVSEHTLVPGKNAPAKEKTADDILVKNIARTGAAPAVHEDGRVNFVQLNKDVRKEYKAALKSRGIGVTVRAPEKPVIIDIDRESLCIIIRDIFEQIKRLSADEARTYVEVYLQGGKVVYIVKIPVAESMLSAAASAAAGDGSFANARKIAEANDGRFVVTLDGKVLKAGMMIDAGE